MKYENHMTSTLVFSFKEYQDLVREATRNDKIVVHADMDGIWYEDGSETSYDDEAVNAALSKVLDVNVTSVHSDDCDFPGIWVAFKKNPSYERVVQILQRYVENDAAAAETDYIRGVLQDICGMTHKEAEALGFGYLLPENTRSGEIIDASFESIWDGSVVLTSKCKINLDTKEVFDIEQVEAEGVNVLTAENVHYFHNGREYVSYAFPEDEYDGVGFWYD